MVEQAGYSFFWKGVPEGEKRNFGVGFAVKNNLDKEFSLSAVGHSPRLMSLRIPLARRRWWTVVSVYAPTLLADISVKGSSLVSWNSYFGTPASDKLLVLEILMHVLGGSTSCGQV